MAVMRHLTVDGTTYDTVGEASVTQVQSSGTKIATVTIDGTATDIYAPSSSGPSPSSTTPAMDGTAAVGTSTDYARADHVHPTDTTRQAALVSGTNIKTINNESILGSGNISISGGGGARAWHGTCSTASSTAAKVVDCTGFTLETGCQISVRFAYAGERARPSLTLNVNGTGAITVFNDNSETSMMNVLYWTAGSKLTFMYDGTYWVFIGEIITSSTTSGKVTTNRLPIASTSVTGIVSVGSGLSVTAGGVLSVTSALPSVSASDNGKVLQVVNGAWAASSLPSASGVSF